MDFSAVDRWVGGDKAFALFFLPQETVPQFISGDVEKGSSLLDGDMLKRGFVFAPYREDVENSFFLIKNWNIIFGEEAIISILEKEKIVSKKCKKKLRTISVLNNKKEYTSAVASCVDEIKASNTISKVVLSRAKRVDLPLGFSPGNLFVNLRKATPKAFCYMVYIPEEGLWMGATPEQLLSVIGDKAQVHALAGTLPVHSGGDWSEKEMDEQQIVVDYIEKTLLSSGISKISKDGPDTFSSGSVRHLRTVFDFWIDDDKMIDDLLHNLHPTPAVCGMPKAEAEVLIDRYEKNSRSYYSGYLGPVGWNGENRFFVNLRCMKVEKESALLYVGAGITADSVPEKEWEETEVKALTLLNIIK